MVKSPVIRFSMLSTGEEVLHGDIVDTNAAWLSKRCFAEGFALQRRVTVGDNPHDIAVELIRCSQVSDVVIVNGGLGPTTDDMTTEAMAMAMNVDLELNTQWLSELNDYFQRLEKKMPSSNIKQAMLPKGAELIANPIGTACGFSLKLNNCLFFFTPGVPAEFKQMVNDEIFPMLHAQFSQVEKKQIQRFYTFGLSESYLNDLFSTLVLPERAMLGYRSETPFIEIKLITSDMADDAIKAVSGQIQQLIGENIVGKNHEMLTTVGQQLIEKNIKIAIAEKFTSGHLVSWLNEEDNCASALTQAWIFPQSYKPTNSTHPLSAVLAMAAAARKNAGANIGMACEAINTEQVALALVTPAGDWGCVLSQSERLSAKQNRQYTSAFMVDMLRRYLGGHDVITRHSHRKICDAVYMPLEKSEATMDN